MIFNDIRWFLVDVAKTLRPYIGNNIRMQISKGDYTGTQKYTRKTAKINYKGPALSKPLSGKTYAPASILPDIASALLVGKRSAREITKHHQIIRQKLKSKKAISRYAIGELLDEERTTSKLQEDLLSLFMVAYNCRQSLQNVAI